VILVRGEALPSSGLRPFFTKTRYHAVRAVSVIQVQQSRMHEVESCLTLFKDRNSGPRCHGYRERHAAGMLDGGGLAGAAAWDGPVGPGKPWRRPLRCGHAASGTRIERDVVITGSCWKWTRSHEIKWRQHRW